MDDKIAWALKLKALAERGVGGEKENAAKLLETIMKKYNIDESVLNQSEIKHREFKYRDKIEDKLLNQIIYKITGNQERWHYKGIKPVLVAECTEAQKVEIDILFEFYMTIWKQELDVFLRAFIQKNKLFSSDPKEVDHSPIDEETRRKINSLMDGIDARTPLKQLKR